jgi:hypothetical protein
MRSVVELLTAPRLPRPCPSAARILRKGALQERPFYYLVLSLWTVFDLELLERFPWEYAAFEDYADLQDALHHFPNVMIMAAAKVRFPGQSCMCGSLSRRRQCSV